MPIIRFTPRGIPGGALAALLVTTFVGYLDTFIVNVAAPSIQDGLHASFTDIQLMVSGYTGAYASGLVLGGRLGDVYGHRRLWLVGTGLFALLSGLCAAAPIGGILVALRIAQGATAAIALPQILAIIRVVAGPGQGQTRALALYGAIAGLAASSGQLIGGLLLAADVLHLGWRSVFLVNVPLCAGALALGSRTISPTTRTRQPQHLDGLGAVLLLGSIGAVLFPLVLATGSGWTPTSFLVLGAGIGSIVWFVLHERRLEARDLSRPLLRLSLLAVRAVRPGLAVAMLYFGGNAGLYLVLAYFEQDGLGSTPLKSGLTFLPLGLGFVLSSAVTPRLLRRMGDRVLLLGAATVALSLPVVAVAARLPAPTPVLTLGLLIHGLGEGFLDVPLIGVILARVRAELAGAASGLVLTAVQIAAVLSVAVTGTVFSTLLRLTRASARDPQQWYGYAFAVTAIGLLVLALGTTATVAGWLRSMTHDTGQRSR